MEALYLGVDVGTGSVRAGLFDQVGHCCGLGSHPIQIFRPAEDHVEQSSEDIWLATGKAIAVAMAAAGATSERIAGIGIDATCSLVVLDSANRPVSITSNGGRETDGRSRRDVIVWMDHRAVDETERINRCAHEVLRYVGGRLSPEMQLPKILWLKEQLPESFSRAARFLDLVDYMTFRATGNDTRSLCTTVCKWTYLGHEARWADDFLSQIGLSELAAHDHARIGRNVRPMGESLGGLTDEAATELGLRSGLPVGIGIIDAHAGGLGLLGAALDGREPAEDELEHRLALISGTSSCHMAVARSPRFVPGVWGPYFSAMIPGFWLTEGGQSATGALIDHVIESHAQGESLAREARANGTTVYALLNQALERLSPERSSMLTEELHILPYHHGNRSPRADPSLRGMVSGLKLTNSLESLALEYLAAIQAIAHGTRHILSVLTEQGYRIDTILATGGDTKNPVFLREHSDITGCRIVLPREPEAVLLGAAVLGAVASGKQPNVFAAMRGMNAAGEIVAPRLGEMARYHERKHAVFQRMHQDQLAYRRLMAEH